MIGFVLAIVDHPESFSWRIFALVIACMVFARSAAMAFNRYVDRDIDQLNPRTQQREIPAGILSSQKVLFFVILNCLAFIISCYLLNPLCLYLSPIALLIVLGYSYTKRFTSLCHFVLGVGLALAPIGAYIAVSQSFGLISVLLGLVVLFWVAGFDIIYALQDEEFDADNHLQSTPVWLGKQGALRLSIFVHFLSIGFLCVAAYLAQQSYPSLNYLHWVGVSIFTGLIIYQHTLVKPNDLTKINLAFFTTNGVASIVFASLYLIDILN